MTAKASLVVLISGSGSNLQAIIDAINGHQLDVEISAVISNQASATGLERAAKESISTHIVDHKLYSSRDAFDLAMIKIIDSLNPDMVVLAGFMRILSEHFINHYMHKLINIHPSLLPKYKGLKTHQQAIDNKDSIHGASVHYVSHELDSGPIVIQAEVSVLADDTAKSLATRVLAEEHKIYPIAIKMHLDKRISFIDNQIQLDNKPLTTPIQWKGNKIINT